jgi:hypothetical protein
VGEEEEDDEDMIGESKAESKAEGDLIPEEEEEVLLVDPDLDIPTLESAGDLGAGF